MGRWVIGDDLVVIENTVDGRISMHIPSGEPLVAGWELFEDLRHKVDAALLVDAGASDPQEHFEQFVALGTDHTNSPPRDQGTPPEVTVIGDPP